MNRLDFLFCNLLSVYISTDLVFMFNNFFNLPAFKAAIPAAKKRCTQRLPLNHSYPLFNSKRTMKRLVDTKNASKLGSSI